MFVSNFYLMCPKILGYENLSLKIEWFNQPLTNGALVNPTRNKEKEIKRLLRMVTPKIVIWQVSKQVIRLALFVILKMQFNCV